MHSDTPPEALLPALACLVLVEASGDAGAHGDVMTASGGRSAAAAAVVRL